MWTGLGGNVNWSTAGNWTPGAPTSSATTDLIFAGTTNTGTLSTPLNQNIATPMLLRSITFDATAGNFFLGGGQIGNSGGNTLTITQSSSNSQNIANAITNTSTTSNGTMTLALAGSGTGVVTLSGIISNSTHPPQVTALTTTAGTTSTFVLSGTNSYTGATNVNGGTLLVNGSTASGSAVTVNNSGTVLGGTGTINGTVNVNANAIINPGPKGTAGTAASVGTLTTGALTLVSTAIFHGDASGTLASNWDKLVVNGLATLRSSTLQLIIASGLTFTPGTTYTLIDANTISGTFNGIADNSLQTFSGYEFIAHYNLAGDGNFELTAVPEPSTWVAGGLAFAMLLYTQRSRLSRTIKRVT
jgi:autotransporter-associated beta strand protein